jgi:Putative DNA-binding domain
MRIQPAGEAIVEAQSKKLGEETQRWPSALTWHSDLHRVWGHCALEFWLLRFREWYERDEAFQNVVDLMETVGIGAYTTYELSGDFDVLLRAWIPAAEVNGFAKRLRDTFPLKDTRKFSVEEVIRHWPWIGERSFAPRECDPDELRELTSPSDVASVNRISDLGHVGRPRDPSEMDIASLERLMAANAVTDIGSTTGIRLLLRLKGNDGLDDDDWRKLMANVAKYLDRISRPPWTKQPGPSDRFILDDVSLYACSDRSLLILCRLPHRLWHDIREALLEPLAAMTGVMQTTTFPVLSRNFVCSRDHLLLDERTEAALGDTGPSSNPEDGVTAGTQSLPPPPQISPSARDYLDRPEGRNFEAKGSAFAPLEGWLGRGKSDPEDHGLSESKGFFRDTIAKTVVAMLNSDGGTLVIGVLELDKFTRQSSEVLEHLAELPVAGAYCVLGLQDPVFRQKDWDGFELKFNRLLKQSVHGEVADLVHISRDWHSKRPLAVVRIEQSDMTHGFYLRDGDERRFFVRRGGSSDELYGPDVLHYIERARGRRKRQP